MFNRSIRSKFLLWLAFLLICLLIGFGVTAFELFRTNQNHQLYEQMQRRLSAVAGDLSSNARNRPMGGFSGRPFERSTTKPNEQTTTETASCETNLADSGSALSSTNEFEKRGPRSRRFPHDHFDDFFPPPKPDDSSEFPEWGFRRPDRDVQHKSREVWSESDGPSPLDSRSEPANLKLTSEVLDLFDQSNPKSFYFAVWNRFGTERLRSTNAPAELETPATVVRAGGPQIRTHGEYMESYL